MTLEIYLYYLLSFQNTLRCTHSYFKSCDLCFQRLVPVDAGSDLFVYKAPDVPCNKIYTVRPYLPDDESAVYSVCQRTFMFTSANLPNLIPDR